MVIIFLDILTIANFYEDFIIEVVYIKYCKNGCGEIENVLFKLNFSCLFYLHKYCHKFY